MDKLNTKSNATVVLGFINVIIYELAFVITLIVSYDKINYYANGYALFLVVYFFFIILFGKLFGSFGLGSTTATDLILSQTLALLFANIVMYCVLCLVAFKLLNVIPMVVLTFIEFVLSTVLNFYENKYVRDNYPVEKAIAIVGEKHYKVLDKIDRYRDIIVDVQKRYDESKVNFDKLDRILKDVDRVITIDIDHEQKKKVFKACYERKIKVFDIPSITDMLLASSSIMHFIDTPVVKVNKFGPTVFESIAKRTIDIVGSLVLLI